MITVKEYNVKIPTYALPYLVNGDSSGLEQEDITTIDKYMKDFYEMMEQEESLIFSIDDSEQNAYFTWRPAFGLACNVQDCTILIVK